MSYDNDPELLRRLDQSIRQIERRLRDGVHVGGVEETSRERSRSLEDEIRWVDEEAAAARREMEEVSLDGA